MTTFLNLVLVLALFAAVLVALQANHSRNGRPRVAGIAGPVGPSEDVEPRYLSR